MIIKIKKKPNVSKIMMPIQKGGDRWQTPPGLRDAIYKKFSPDGKMFDPCPANPDFDGLSIPWKECNYVNPPYSRGQQHLWVTKALSELKHNRKTYLLLPTDTSTALFHFIMDTATAIYLFSSRIRFVGATGSPKFGSMLVEYSDIKANRAVFYHSIWNKKLNVLKVS